MKYRIILAFFLLIRRAENWAMKVTSCPYVFLYDKNGKLVYSHLGYSPGDEEVLFQKIKEL